MNKLKIHSWVSIPELSEEELSEILENVLISRYGLGGTTNANKSISEIVGDGSFWDKFVYHRASTFVYSWRLGSVNEECLTNKKITHSEMLKLAR